MEPEKYKQFSLTAFSIINKLWSYLPCIAVDC